MPTSSSLRCFTSSILIVGSKPRRSAARMSPTRLSSEQRRRMLQISAITGCQPTCLGFIYLIGLNHQSFNRGTYHLIILYFNYFAESELWLGTIHGNITLSKLASGMT